MKDLIIHVQADSVFSGTGKSSGKPFSTQSFGLTDTKTGFVNSAKMFIKDAKAALAPGQYKITLESAYVDRGGQMVLVPSFTKV